jgi:Fic family protein
MHRVYLAKGAHATTAIEGNSLSEEEVLGLVEGRLEVPPSQQYLAQEVENIVGAFNEIADDLILGGSDRLTTESVKRFNALVLKDLELEPGVEPGQIRTRSVVVARYRGAPAEDCEHLLAHLCAWLDGVTFETDDEEWKIPYALLKAMLAHLYLAWIHPFDDGNGRTARLMEFQILLAAGVPAPAAHLLSNFYNETRGEYYRQLEYASVSGGDIVPFLTYGLHGFVDAIRTQLQRVWNQLYADRWEQYVYETFGHTHTRARERQRTLALELSKRDEPTPRRDMRRLSVDLAEAYAGGTERMLSRDLNALEGMGLIERVKPGSWRATKEQILAFRPFRRDA